MVFGKILKGLFGDKEKVPVSYDPFGQKLQQGAVAPPPARPKREVHAIVQRDEILDGRSRIAGYRFAAHCLGSGYPPSPDMAVAALLADNIVAFAERRLAIVPLTVRDWNSADYRQIIAPNTTFLLESPAHSERDDWRKTLEEIKSAGGRIGIEGVDAADDLAGALADLVLLDFGGYSIENLERITQELATARPNMALVADGIGSWAEHRLVQSMRVRYSLGSFAAAPDEMEQGEKLNQSRLVLIEMLNLLRREADAAEIAAVAKRDPGVIVKIIGIANSPMSGLSSSVASIEQAVLVLGREMLYRWLSLAMFRSGAGGGRDEALLELALCRGRLLELLATGSRSRQECDELFLVGLLSLLDSLLGMPMAKIVARMHLPQAVADVLVKSEGPYGRFLMLALSLEKGHNERAAEVATELGIEPGKIETSSSAARFWAEAALQAN